MTSWNNNLSTIKLTSETIETNKLTLINDKGENYNATVLNNNLYINYGDNEAIEIDPVNRTLTGQIIDIKQQTNDPEKPKEGQSIMWLSDGNGIGNPGDLMVASTISGETRYNRLLDYNKSYPWM